MAIWRPKPSRDELEEQLGKDLVEWGKNVEDVYDPLPEDTGELKPDDVMPPKKKATTATSVPITTVVRDKNGNVMPCMVCGDVYTIDGRYCRRHSP